MLSEIKKRQAPGAKGARAQPVTTSRARTVLSIADGNWEEGDIGTRGTWGLGWWYHNRSEEAEVQTDRSENSEDVGLLRFSGYV